MDTSIFSRSSCEEVEVILHCMTNCSSDSSWTSKEKMPFNVDFSEGGWATDYAAAIIAFLFFISSIVSKHYRNHQHFRWMFLGTAIAHCFGGLCHKYYFNRAGDSYGQIGFYVTMGIGYIGNCMRYGFGWGLKGYWPMISIVNMVLFIATGIWVSVDMKIQGRAITDPCERHFEGIAEDPRCDPYLPDQAFMGLEAVASFGEIVANIMYLLQNRTNVYAIVAAFVNVIGWVSVYAIGFLYMYEMIEDYDPSLMQRLFHYCMIVMMWSISSISVESADADEVGDNTSHEKTE